VLPIITTSRHTLGRYSFGRNFRFTMTVNMADSAIVKFAGYPRCGSAGGPQTSERSGREAADPIPD